jgi:cyclohexyl-isocyanide hydratase
MSSSELNRRELLRLLAFASAAVAASPAPTGAAEPTPAPAASLHRHQPQLRMGSEKIAILVYPEFTALDALGPHYPLSGMMGATVRFVARTLDPVPCEGASQGGFCVKPHFTFANCPADLDLLLVPGGLKGTLDALADAETMRFIATAGARAKRVSSVCTGSLLLGAAGLLKGRRATSHWQTLELLKETGAVPVAERLVFDGEDRVTAAGVSAGLDLGFELLRRYRGDFYAKGMQLLGEYDPQPPFPGGGNPRTADPAVVTMLNQMHVPVVEQFRGAVQAAHKASKPNK